MLFFLILLPFLSLLILFLIPRKFLNLIKILSLSFSLFIFFYSILLFFFYDIYQKYDWKILLSYIDPNKKINLKFLDLDDFEFMYFFSFFDGINYVIGVDAISLLFIILTTLLFPLCFLLNWESVKYRFKDFAILLFLLEFFLINMFSCLDLFFFYIFFESVLIPMFFIIGIWGSRHRKIHAVYQFFLYTFFGSVFMLMSILIIYIHVGCTYIPILKNFTFSENRQLLIWFGLFLGFSIKVPMIPFHIWLPEAHVEAPTTGSILLAGILLKLGTYGFMRFLIPLFPYALNFFTPFIFVICLISIVYGSFSTIRQVDLKKIIAYSSIVHMNFCIIGLFTKNIEGLFGSFFLMISHGIVSGALFFCIGILYDRYHTRILYYYGGLVQVMPIFSVIFLIFILSNMGFPGTSGFIGEILVLISVFSFNFKVALLISTSMVFSAIYSLWLYNRVIFGEIKYFFLLKNAFYFKFWFKKFSDITKREFMISFPLLFFNFILGVYPNIIFNFSYFSILNLL